MNSAQAKNLALKSGWEVADYGQTDNWTMSFHKHDVAAIWVRFSPTGRLTKINAVDFITPTHRSPTHDKATRLSHYLTEGIV